MGEIPKYHFSHRFAELSVGELFTDVSLVCQGNIVIPSHRIVLSSHSQCLRSALIDANEMIVEDSVIMMPDFSYDQVHQLIQVMYGEVESAPIDQSLLTSLGMSTETSVTATGSPMKKKNVILKCRSESQEGGGQLMVAPEAPVSGTTEAGPVDKKELPISISDVTVEKRNETNISSRENIANMLTLKAVKKPKTKASMSFECPDCGSLFAALETLYSHLEKCEKQDEEGGGDKVDRAPGQTLFKCSECGNVFDSIEKINAHMESTHFEADSADTVSAELEEDDEEVRLEEVEETIITVGGEGGITVEVGEAVHMDNVKTEQKFMCSICCSVFGSEESLEKHYQTHPGLETAGAAGGEGDAATEYDVRYMCSECNEVFDSVDDLDNHASSAHKRTNQVVRYQCNFCREVFQTVEDHNQHTVQQHSQFITDQVNIHQNSNYFKCSRCSETFGVVRELTEHIIANHQDEAGVKKLSRPKRGESDTVEWRKSNEALGVSLELRSRCTYCLKTMLAKDELENHYKTVHPGLDYGIYMCSHCNKIFRSIEYLERHERVHQEIRPFQCGGCSAKFTLASTLHNHAKKCQSIPINAMNKILLPRRVVNKSPAQVYTCTFCSGEFPSMAQMKQHMRESCVDRLKPRPSPLTRRILPKNDKMVISREASSREMVIPVDTTGLTLGQLGNPNMNQSSSECVVQISLPETDMGDLQEEESTTVILDSAGNVLEGDPSVLDGAAGVLDGTTTVLDATGTVLDGTTTVLDGAVLDDTVLRGDVGTDDMADVGETVCADVVSEVYVDYDDTVTEGAIPAQRKRRKPVENADKVYRSKKEKAWNVRYGCDKERRFRCAMCPNAYLAKDHLIAHIRTHTGEKPFQCEKCKERFMYRSTWSNHRIRCIEGPEVQNKLRKFNCQYCSASFFARDHRRCHERIHTGEKPWKCDACGDTFQYRNRWKTHVSRCDGTRESADPLNVKKARMRQSSRRGRYKCSQCDQTFNKATRLETHSSVHPGQKLHGCENCGTRFYNKVSLDEHVERCRELDAFKREELNLDDGEEMVQEVVEEEIIDTFHEQVIECETVLDSNFETHTIETWIPPASPPIEQIVTEEEDTRKRKRPRVKDDDGEMGDLPDIQTEIDEIRRSPRRKIAKKRFDEMSYEERSVQNEKEAKRSAKSELKSEKFSCDVCDLSFDGNLQFERHMNSRKHRNNLEESSSQSEEEVGEM